MRRLKRRSRVVVLAAATSDEQQKATEQQRGDAAADGPDDAYGAGEGEAGDDGGGGRGLAGGYDGGGVDVPVSARIVPSRTTTARASTHRSDASFRSKA